MSLCSGEALFDVRMWSLSGLLIALELVIFGNCELHVVLCLDVVDDSLTAYYKK